MEALPKRSIHSGLAGLSIAVILGLCSLIGWQEWRERHAMAETSVINTAQVLAHQVESTLNQTDAFLKSVGLRYLDCLANNRTGIEQLKTQVRRESPDHPLVSRIGITNQDGLVVFNTAFADGEKYRIDLSDRDYFERAKSGELGLIYAGPISARLTGETSLGLVRRLQDSKGEFIGVIFAVVPVSLIGQQFGRLDLGNGGVINLRTLDLAQVVRYPELTGDDRNTGNRNVSKTIQTMMQANPDSHRHIYKAVAPIDGVERVYAYQKFERAPFWMTVGRATADFSPSWYRNIGVLACLALAMTALLLWGAHRFNRQNLHLARRIAEKERAEQELTASEQKLNDILDNVHGLIYLKDREGNYRYANRSLRELFGAGTDEVIGRRDEFFDPDAAAAQAGNDRRVLDHGEIVHCEESRFDKTTGQTRTFWTVKLPLRNLQGEIYALCGISTDISARIEAERALKASEERFRLVSVAAQDAIAIVDGDGVVNFWNEAATRIFGFNTAEILGRTLHQCIVPERYRAAFANGLIALQQKSDQEGVGQTIELTAQRKNGEEFPIEVSFSMLRQEKEWIGIGIVRDISERRHVVQELNQHRHHLEQVVAERTRELALAKTVAEAASGAKSSFLANMSHEIRTPMNAILGMAHLLLKTGLSPAQRDYLQKMLASSQHLLGILNDVLDYSKLEAGKMAIEAIEFSLEECVTDVANLAMEQAAAKRLEVVIDLAPTVPRHLIGDPMRIKQILANYLSNALKFTEVGEIAIRVELQDRKGDDLLLRFSVRDTGAGLSEAQCQQLFQSFQQADDSITRKHGGTGLGLAICKDLATLMNGEVGVDSVLGQGSSFWFSARLRCGPALARPVPAIAPVSGTRILVVDDNATSREVLSAMLDSMFFPNTTLASGEEALTTLMRAESEGAPFGAVLLDWRMPGMDGIETAREIRALALDQPPLLMMITAFDRDEVLPAARAVGISTTLTKPITPSQLFDGLLEALDWSKLAPPDGSPLPPPALASAVALTGLRVLLVEDNEINREVAQALLEDVGIEVDWAENGQVAVDKAEAGHYDMVLMDIQMPVMDGLTATRALRRTPGLATLPIIAMTANAMHSDRDNCLEAGMNDHIGKPIDPDLLAATLLKWAGPGRGAPAALVPLPPTAVPVSETLALDSLRQIEGLDVDRGLYQVRQNQAIYRGLLQKIAERERDFIARVRTALAQAADDSAAREVHTLKGLAAQAGAETLRTLAAELEQALLDKAPDRQIDEQLAALGAQLEALLEAIERCLNSSDAND